MKIKINREHLFKEVVYPNRYRQGNLLTTASVIFGLIFAFLILLKPFEVNTSQQRISYTFICLVHALIPAFILLLYFSAFNYLKKNNAKETRWSLFREYVNLAAIFLSTGLCSFLVRDLIYFSKDNWSLHYLLEEVRNCLVAGVILYFFLRLSVFYFQSKKDSSLIFKFSLPEQEPDKKVTDMLFHISTQVRQDDFSLISDHLIFVRAEGNYIEITTLGQSGPVTELKRISLTQFELQIAGNPYMFRCHRAYLVNLKQVKSMSGNSQGYQLSFNHITAQVPVSRSQLVAFKDLYGQLQKGQAALD